MKDVQTEVVSVGRNEASLVNSQVTASTKKALPALIDWQVLTQEGLSSKGAGLKKALEIPNTLLIIRMILSGAD